MFGYSKPIIEESFNPDRTKLTIFIGHVGIKEIQNYEKQGQSISRLSFEEQKVLELFNDKEYITRVEIEKHLNCKKTKSYEIVKSLINKKIIYKDGLGSNIKYLKIDCLKNYSNQFERG